MNSGSWWRRHAAGPAAMLFLLAISTVTQAHHSNAMFDKSQVVEVTATVREFQWTNPHVWIQVYIRNDGADEEEWSIEGGGPNSLFRSGWRPDSFEAGDVVTIRMYPMRDGSKAALFVGAKLADGKTLGTW